MKASSKSVYGSTQRYLRSVLGSTSAPIMAFQNCHDRIISTIKRRKSHQTTRGKTAIKISMAVSWWTMMQIVMWWGRSCLTTSKATSSRQCKTSRRGTKRRATSLMEATRGLAGSEQQSHCTRQTNERCRLKRLHKKFRSARATCDKKCKH